MGNILYLIAVILVIIWAIGFFANFAGNIIHLLLVLAVISILLRIIGGSRPAGEESRNGRRDEVCPKRMHRTPISSCGPECHISDP